MALPVALGPDPALLVVAMVLDVTFGDPVYGWHPVRLIGRSLSAIECALRRSGLDGCTGGILLFILLAAIWVFAPSAVAVYLAQVDAWLGAAVHVFFLYSLLALGSLLRCGRRIENALRADDLQGARVAVSEIVGRDTAFMDPAACRRAAVESLAENLTDGVVSPLFWYALGGLPLVVLFKVVSTMDSMVGYKSPEYVRFGWCGARLDDAMNFLPARITWLLIAMTAAVLPGYSASKALHYGLCDHSVLPSPNSGWSEAAAAGGLQRRLIGPIWSRGELVTDIWIGAAADPPLSTAADYDRAAVLVATSGLFAAALALATVIAMGTDTL